MAMRASAEPRVVHLTVNGRATSGLAEPRMLLADFLRHVLGLTGTKVGCEQGACGACTIRLNGYIVRSCIILAVQVDGASVETVEGMAVNGDLHPIQEAFRQKHGLQCGFCTPGMLITAQALLEQNPEPSEDEIRASLSGNVCRCTGYVGVVASVREAAARLAGQNTDH
jgi:carbon-monoxide dehydrogenase small subunit